MFALAEHLHITVDQVLKMSLIEFKSWLAYLTLKAKQEKRDANKRAVNTRRR
jgi:hypothetical protein